MHLLEPQPTERRPTPYAVRPTVDVVVPFFGPRESLERLIRGLATVRLRPGDTVTVADNRPAGVAPVASEGAVRVVRAPGRQSSYYARNVGAAQGEADWLLFLDADVSPHPDLLDRYFERDPGERAGVLAGGIEDEPCGADASPAARFAALAGSMSQGNTLRGEWAYVQTANCAIRREAFDAVGGFCDEIRSGGDADICLRLRAAGWEIEPRDGAVVVHTSRRELAKLVRQRARMGAGAAWVNERHPGSFPAARLPGLAKWAAVSLARACSCAIRGRREEALVRALDPLVVWAFELGRRLPNAAPGNGTGAATRTTVPVTVVIPAHNREQMLARALRSVLAQSPAPEEIVVVDDASSDGTAAVAEEMGARVIRHDQNRGEGAARNSGIEAATQPWVALLDSDDEWLPHHLGRLWAARDAHVLVASSCLRCGDDPAAARFHGAARGRPLRLASPAQIVFPENPVPVSAVMIRRDVALAAGGYGDQRHCADFDLLLRCLERGTGVVLPEVGAIYHVHADQVSQQREQMKASHTRIACSYADRDWFDPRQVRRWKAAVAWDMWRAEGGPRRAAGLARPWHLPALLRLWAWRLQVRRSGARSAPAVRAHMEQMPVKLPAYAVVTPVKDEAAHLAYTAAGMVAQTHRPVEWVIVDDGSTDGTRELAESYPTREPWIRVVGSAADGERARGGRVVRAFEHGRTQIGSPHEIVAKVDGDIELPPDYFARVTGAFARDPRAGIVGGRVLVPGRGDSWIPERVGRHTVHGAIKAYRVTCLADFGGLRASMGWDGIDEYGAKARGWKVIPLADLEVHHHARRGSKQRWWRARIEEGRGAHYMGYLPAFVLVRAGYRMLVERPPLLGGVALLAGWMGAWLRRAPRVDDPQAIAALRHEQRGRLRRLLKGGRVQADVVEPEALRVAADL